MEAWFNFLSYGKDTLPEDVSEMGLPSLHTRVFESCQRVPDNLVYAVLLDEKTRITNGPAPFGEVIHQNYRKGHVVGPLFGLHFTGCYGDQGVTWDERFYLTGWFPDFDDQVTADQPVQWRCIKLWCSNRHGRDAEPGNQKGMVMAMPMCFNHYEAAEMDIHYPGLDSAM